MPSAEPIRQITLNGHYTREFGTIVNNGTDENDEEHSLLLKPKSQTYHPLQYTWSMYMLSHKEGKTWEQSLTKINKIQFAEEFWATLNYMLTPSQLTQECDYYLFRQGAKPAWEHYSNVGGGRWSLTVNPFSADKFWIESLMALVGDQFTYDKDEGKKIPPLTDFICGCAIQHKLGRRDGDRRQSSRSGGSSGATFKLALWTKDSLNEEIQMLIGQRWRSILQQQDTEHHVPTLTYFSHSNPKNHLYRV